MSKRTNETLPTVNVAGPAGQAVITAMADAKQAKKRAAQAAKTLKGKNGSVTELAVDWAGEIRTQMGERKIAVGGADGEYTAIRRFLVDNGTDKGLSTNLAQLVSWIANDATLVERAALVTKGDDGKPTGHVGWNAAHAAVKRLVSPPARTYKDTLGELADLLGEESDEWKAAIATLSGRDVLRAIAQMIENGRADAEDGEADE